ncbi:MAG: hypothetical protein R3C11_16545 [Planctomycetaceae bacterium]
MADRYSYVPQIGLILFLCWLIPAYLFENKAIKSAAIFVALLFASA